MESKSASAIPSIHPQAVVILSTKKKKEKKKKKHHGDVLLLVCNSRKADSEFKKSTFSVSLSWS